MLARTDAYVVLWADKAGRAYDICVNLWRYFYLQIKNASIDFPGHIDIPPHRGVSTFCLLQVAGLRGDQGFTEPGPGGMNTQCIG